MAEDDPTVTVLCLGDRFITADALAAAAEHELAGPGRSVRCVGSQTAWPDEPFGAVDGVREASGDPVGISDLAVDADVLLTHLAPVTAQVLDAATGLRVVGVTRGGPVNVDLAAATAKGVPVVFLPGRNLQGVAEFTLALLLGLPRGLAGPARALSVSGDWDPTPFRFDRAGIEIRAAAIGVVGAGAVGRRVAELVSAIGAQVFVHDPFADPNELRASGWVPVGFDELLARSDIVTVHARLTDETRHMFDAAAFAAMKPGAYFVNTARGELVRQDALLDALESGRLAGAALDVFDPEPPAAGDALLARPDVLATPHIAGASRQVATESASRIARAVAGFLDQGVIEHCANPGWQEHRPAGHP